MHRVKSANTNFLVQVLKHVFIVIKVVSSDVFLAGFAAEEQEKPKPLSSTTQNSGSVTI